MPASRSRSTAEQLVESSVGQTILVGLRQSWAIGRLVISAASRLGPNRPTASTSGT